MNVPIKSWCQDVEEGAIEQAVNLASHPAIFRHVALMPDCHQGYGMPIGGVVALQDAVSPNMVGVDIGCGMISIKTNLKIESLGKDDIDNKRKRKIRSILDHIKAAVPMGEGHAHQREQEWQGFTEYFESDNPRFPRMKAGWYEDKVWTLAKKNLGTLGSGNHFLELQHDQEGTIWLMIHSGSRNLGHCIATYYNKVAIDRNQKWHSKIPHEHLAFFPAGSQEGKDYIRDMRFALQYAFENRKRMMKVFMDAVEKVIPTVKFLDKINIHHNYATIENHFGKNVWVHRKGATSAKDGEYGIIPGSMGTSSYIVKGLGCPESFMSCSHGAGRVMSRTKANETFTKEQADEAMGEVVYDRWKMEKSRKKDAPRRLDLSESPMAYKDIDDVIESEKDLVEVMYRLKPLGVLKG